MHESITQLQQDVTQRYLKLEVCLCHQLQQQFQNALTQLINSLNNIVGGAALKNLLTSLSKGSFVIESKHVTS